MKMEWVVNNIEEAKDFFLKTSTGSILCRRDDGQQRITECFYDAELFFEGEPPKDIK